MWCVVVLIMLYGQILLYVPKIFPKFLALTSVAFNHLIRPHNQNHLLHFEISIEQKRKEKKNTKIERRN